MKIFFLIMIFMLCSCTTSVIVICKKGFGVDGSETLICHAEEEE